MRKQTLVELHNKSSHKTGEMPMAALRNQLDRATLLFLMCSGYTAMSHHTSPARLHTPTSLSFFILSSGFGLYVVQCLTLPQNTSISFKWESGRTTHLLILFLLTQTVEEHRVRETWRGNRYRGVKEAGWYFVFWGNAVLYWTAEIYSAQVLISDSGAYKCKTINAYISYRKVKLNSNAICTLQSM